MAGWTVVGICGSDVHFLVSERIGPFIVEKPIIIGHEASGTIVEVGKNVTSLVPGDRVVIEPGVGCRSCTFCKDGNYHLCADMVFCACPPIDGNLSRYYVHDADFCFKYLQVTRTGGVVILVGCGKFEMTLPLTSALIREVDIRGVFRYNNDYPTAIEMVKTGKANVKSLITHHFKIENTVKAFEKAKAREGNPIKIIIHANADWKP